MLRDASPVILAEDLTHPYLSPGQWWFEILRLRGCFASRSSHSAQDDKIGTAVNAEHKPHYPEARSQKLPYSTVTDFAKFLG